MARRIRRQWPRHRVSCTRVTPSNAIVRWCLFFESCCADSLAVHPFGVNREMLAGECQLPSALFSFFPLATRTVRCTVHLRREGHPCYLDGTVSRINILKQVKIGDRWEMRSIPKKANGQPDWNALPEGTYFLEWREAGKRRRSPAGTTVSQALEARRRKHTEREALKLGFLAPRAPAEANRSPLQLSIDRYLRSD